MDTCLLDMLHHATNKGLAFRVPQAVDITLDGVIQKAVQQNRRIVRNLHGLSHIAL